MPKEGEKKSHVEIDYFESKTDDIANDIELKKTTPIGSKLSKPTKIALLISISGFLLNVILLVVAVFVEILGLLIFSIVFMPITLFLAVLIPVVVNKKVKVTKERKQSEIENISHKRLSSFLDKMKNQDKIAVLICMILGLIFIITGIILRIVNITEFNPYIFSTISLFLGFILLVVSPLIAWIIYR